MVDAVGISRSGYYSALGTSPTVDMATHKRNPGFAVNRKNDLAWDMAESFVQSQCVKIHRHNNHDATVSVELALYLSKFEVYRRYFVYLSAMYNKPDTLFDQIVDFVLPSTIDVEDSFRWADSVPFEDRLGLRSFYNMFPLEGVSIVTDFVKCSCPICRDGDLAEEEIGDHKCEHRRVCTTPGFGRNCPCGDRCPGWQAVVKGLGRHYQDLVNTAQAWYDHRVIVRFQRMSFENQRSFTTILPSGKLIVVVVDFSGYGSASGRKLAAGETMGLQCLHAVVYTQNEAFDDNKTEGPRNRRYDCQLTARDFR